MLERVQPFGRSCPERPRRHPHRHPQAAAHPSVYQFAILAAGRMQFGLAVRQGVFVKPYAEAAKAEARRLITRAPRDVDLAADLLRQIVGRQIEHSARHPSPEFQAAGPVRVMAIEPGRPPRFVAELRREHGKRQSDFGGWARE